jgi:hypothetical protein
MKNMLIALRKRRNMNGRLAFISLTLLLLVGLFMASVFLPPLATPVQALNAPQAAVSQSPSSAGESGTLASFTALIPEVTFVSLPFVSH